MIKRKIAIPIYGQDVEFYYGNHKEISKINDSYSFSKLKKSISCRAGWLLDPGNKFVLLFRNDIELLPGDIAHECKHLINFIYTALGIDLDIDNDEHECYLLGWLVDKVHSLIKI